MFGYIYITTNLLNGRKYIGQKRGSVRPSYLGSGIAIKEAIKKYGKICFDVELLEIANSLEELNALEIKYIKEYNALNNSEFYNIALGGNCWGSPHLIETRKKMSQKAMGRTANNKGIPNPKQREKMILNNPMKNPEISKRVSEKLKEQFRLNPKTGIKGRKAHNKIESTFSFQCEECNKVIEQRDTKKNRRDRSRFCNKSCAASFSNKQRHKLRIIEL